MSNFKTRNFIWILFSFCGVTNSMVTKSQFTYKIIWLSNLKKYLKIKRDILSCCCKYEWIKKVSNIFLLNFLHSLIILTDILMPIFLCTRMNSLWSRSGLNKPTEIKKYYHSILCVVIKHELEKNGLQWSMPLCTI